MRVAMTGSSGLIGTALCRALVARGDQVVPVVRRRAGAGEVGWDLAAGTIDVEALRGVDAVVNLAGAGIGDRRWSAARRREIAESRVRGTTVLAGALASLDPPPRVLVSGSAVGFYGDRGDEVLTEQSTPGSDFLARVCRDWESAAGSAETAGVRVVTVRSGIVLAREGGALARQLPLFRLGLGGRLGNGRQWTSWVTLEDEVGAIVFALDTASLTGPLNVSAPEPVTNRRFTAALGRAVHRPAVMAVPRPALQLALGRQLVDEVLLASQRVLPAALEEAGFAFSYPGLGAALRAVLGEGT